MTKQEAIEKVQTLIVLLEALPDSVDIMFAEVWEDLHGIEDTEIYLNSGIEAVSEAVGLPVEETTPDEFVHRTIHAGNCEYVQLDERADNKNRPK